MWFMRVRIQQGDSYWRKFFRNGLIIEESLEDHLKVAYILVKHGKFSYESVKEMTQIERTLFLKIIIEEVEKQNNELKNK